MTDAPTQLLGLNEKTRKPERTRIPNAVSARTLVTRVVKDDESRARQRAIVKGLVDGNPPYSDAQRRQNGLGWTCNLNFMEGEGLMDSSGVPYYAIFNGVEEYADCCTAHEPEHPDHEQWGRLISKHFHALLKRWPQFDWNMQQASYQMRLHGIGPCLFDNPVDWRFRSIASGMILAPQGAASSIDKRLPFLVVRVAYRVHELWDKIRDEDAAASAGWNVEAIKDAMLSVAKGEISGNGQPIHPTWEQFQERLKNNDLTTAYNDCQVIHCAHLFVMELSGRVSHFIVTEGEIADSPDAPRRADKAGFLFSSIAKYGGYEQALVVFFQNIGDGTWHSVRGLASKAFRHLEVSNRLKCRAVDGVFIKGSLVLKPGTSKTSDKMQLMQVGPMTMIPAGAELVQVQMNGATDELLAVDRLLGNHLGNNIGQFSQRSLSREDGRGEVPTAAQVNAQVSKESMLGQGQMSLFFTTLDMLYAETFRRASDPAAIDDEAIRFQADCMAEGVPAEALANMKYVRANRASGYGSPQMRQLTDQQMMPLIAMLPEDGKIAYLEDAVAGIKGADKVRRYVPRQHIPDRSDWEVAVENEMIASGRKPVLAAGQNDIIHLHGHLEDAANVLEPVKDAMDTGKSDPQMLENAAQYTEVMAAHVEEHLGRVLADPARRGQGKMFESQLENIVSFSGALRSAIRQAQRDARLAAEQQQQATALSALDQAKVDQVRTQTALDVEKTQSKIQSEHAKAVNKMRIETARASLERERAKTDA